MIDLYLSLSVFERIYFWSMLLSFILVSLDVNKYFKNNLVALIIRILYFTIIFLIPTIFVVVFELCTANNEEIICILVLVLPILLHIGMGYVEIFKRYKNKR